MMLSEQTIGAIARALLNDRKTLAESLEFWSVPARARRFPNRHAAIAADLEENAGALTELADHFAPWLKQRADWPTIAGDTPITH